MPEQKSDDARIAAVRQIAKILIVAAPAFDPETTPGDKQFAFWLSAADIMELRELYGTDVNMQERELELLRKLSMTCADFYHHLAAFKQKREALYRAAMEEKPHA